MRLDNAPTDGQPKPHAGSSIYGRLRMEARHPVEEAGSVVCNLETIAIRTRFSDDRHSGIVLGTPVDESVAKQVQQDLLNLHDVATQRGFINIDLQDESCIAGLKL